MLRPALVVATSGLLLGAAEASGQAVAVTARVAERVDPLPAQVEWVAGAGVRLMDGEVHSAASPTRLLVDTQALVRRSREQGVPLERTSVRATVERTGPSEVLIRLDCVQDLADGDEVVVTRVVASNS